MVPITAFIAVVTGNPSTPGPTLKNVADALDMKNPVGLCISLQSLLYLHISPAQIPHDGKHGA